MKNTLRVRDKRINRDAEQSVIQIASDVLGIVEIATLPSLRPFVTAEQERYMASAKAMSTVRSGPGHYAPRNFQPPFSAAVNGEFKR